MDYRAQIALFEGHRWEGRAIIHLDLDAFFASVAQLDDPELRGKPVIVGGDASRRGVVSTASYEARAFGVHSAMSSKIAERLCPQAIWVRPDFTRYHELSGQVFDILRSYTPAVRPVSIDEAFADITPDSFEPRHPAAIAAEILARVAALGITGSIGLSTSMTVSKVGSDFQKPRGLTVVEPGTEAAFLAPLPVRKMSGIGPKAAQKLHQLGVETLGQLAATPLDDLRPIFGSLTEQFHDRAGGIDVRPVTTDDPVKSVSNENTYPRDLHTREDIDEALRALAAHVGRRLRQQNLKGRTLSLKVRYGDFSTKVVSRTYDPPFNNERIFLPWVLGMFTAIWPAGRGVRLLGVGVSNFTADREQLGLFDTDAAEERASHEQLVSKLDSIRDKFGEDALLSGRRLLDTQGAQQETPTPPPQRPSHGDQPSLPDARR
ncbi:MAG: DNA polymerase IV [Coriobacteriia bacterium]|nr:DNA polymerase IV [Coriobacteriia bacterium]